MTCRFRVYTRYAKTICNFKQRTQQVITLISLAKTATEMEIQKKRDNEKTGKYREENATWTKK